MRVSRDASNNTGSYSYTDRREEFILNNTFPCSGPGHLVALAKKACSITKPNSEMTDAEIRTVAHWIWQQLPDSTWKDGKIVPGRIGVDLILFVTVNEFPEFYQRYGLGQFN